MFTSARKCHGLIVLLFLSVMLVQTSGADTEGFTAKDMLPAFLSDVVGLDLTKYNITNEHYSVNHPSEYGGEVKEENVRFDLTSNSGSIFTVHIMGLFLNGFNGSIFVYPPTNAEMFFKTQPATNALDESRNILQRYKAFAQDYGLETSHIDPALTMLNNAIRASPSSADSFTFNKITGFVPSVTYVGNVKQETTQRSITWTYTERGVDMPNKSLKIDFGINKLHFVDTWNLYTVGSFSVISEDEALQIAFDAADNYDVFLVDENGTRFIAEKPRWKNYTSIGLRMVHGGIYIEPFSGGNATRDPLALYPRWQTQFYFNDSIGGGVNGIAVFVWGDTKEIAYIGVTGSHGYPPWYYSTIEQTEPPPESSSSDSLEGLEGYPTLPTLPSLNNLEGNFDTTTPIEPSATQTEDPTESESSNPPPSMLLIGGTVATAIAIVGAAVVLKKRRK